MTSLISDTNSILQLAGNGDLISLQSNALGYKFKNSNTTTDTGSPHRATLIYNQNMPPNPGQHNLAYRLFAAGGTTILYVCTGTNVSDPSASTASTNEYSAVTVNGPVYSGQGKWVEVN